MKNIIIFCITAYQHTLSPDHGILRKAGIRRAPACVFYPTCSEYAKESVRKYGVVKGMYKGFKRVLRCHPWQKPRVDSAG